MCSWNLSALALGLITETDQIGVTFRDFLRGAAADIAVRLTEDPAPAVVEPIKLPEGVSQETASRRLDEMADIVERALGADTKAGARGHLEALFGPEIEGILAREKRQMNRSLRARDASAVAGVLGAKRPPKTTRSGGA